MPNEIDKRPQHIILRLWLETLADGSVEWRGKLHHVQTNQIRYFRDWPALLPTLLAMLREADLPTTWPGGYRPAGGSPGLTAEGDPPPR